MIQIQHLFGYKAENLLYQRASAITSATASHGNQQKRIFVPSVCSTSIGDEEKIGLLQYDSPRRRGVKFHCRFARWSLFFYLSNLATDTAARKVASLLLSSAQDACRGSQRRSPEARTYQSAARLPAILPTTYLCKAWVSPAACYLCLLLLFRSFFNAAAGTAAAGSQSPVVSRWIIPVRARCMMPIVSTIRAPGWLLHKLYWLVHWLTG